MQTLVSNIYILYVSCILYAQCMLSIIVYFVLNTLINLYGQQNCTLNFNILIIIYIYVQLCCTHTLCMVSDVKNRYIPADLKIVTSQIIQLVSGSLASLIQARGTGFFLGYKHLSWPFSQGSSHLSGMTPVTFSPSISSFMKSTT